jgi:hypothetical protein
MRFGRRFWSRLALGVSVAAAAPGWAQQQGEAQDAETTAALPQPLEEAKPAQAATPSPALLSGPSLRETGRIGAMPSAAPVNLIEPESQLTSPNEKAIGPAATALGDEEQQRKPPAGTIDKRVLEREIAERFATIDDCRIDVARSHRVLPTAITAGTLLLRWTIERDGTTGATEVVATSAIDMSVMDCAKQVMSQWTFTRPRGGSVTVERAFTFKPLRGS